MEVLGVALRIDPGRLGPEAVGVLGPVVGGAPLKVEAGVVGRTDGDNAVVDLDVAAEVSAVAVVVACVGVIAAVDRRIGEDVLLFGPDAVVLPEDPGLRGTVVEVVVAGHDQQIAIHVNAVACPVLDRLRIAAVQFDGGAPGCTGALVEQGATGVALETVDSVVVEVVTDDGPVTGDGDVVALPVVGSGVRVEQLGFLDPDVVYVLAEHIGRTGVEAALVVFVSTDDDR